MIWYHRTPDSSVVLLLLLLFFSPFGPLKSCSFNYPPIATSDFSQDIKPLKEYLLLDYKVSMPFNLKPDIFCSSLWDLHFINENLKKLIKVSGKRLKKLFEKIYNHTKFVEDCNIEVSLSLYYRKFCYPSKPTLLIGSWKRGSPLSPYPTKGLTGGYFFHPSSSVFSSVHGKDASAPLREQFKVTTSHKAVRDPHHPAS
ncbi:fms-related tyrosine kinase 3 ligand isoform X2 [Erythrolamprus reginae]|uniref:fms-related tyrosine kinase 3 ligand isoform X2 n=1 Tax=Erythrolamprus reginae TaxID=121349 RepID=UPI00396C8171